MLHPAAFDDWPAWPGALVGALLVVGSLEFVGRFEEHGWKPAATIVPIGHPTRSLPSSTCSWSATSVCGPTGPTPATHDRCAGAHHSPPATRRRTPRGRGSILSSAPV